MIDFIVIEKFIDYILFVSCIYIIFGSLYISYKTQFVQCRLLPQLFSMLTSSFTAKKEGTASQTILPYKALLTAMSTTLGIGTIVGPIVAIHWGGPGALLGFLLTAFFGSAATFSEVDLCIKYRKIAPGTGEIQGGPMQYLKVLLSPFAATWYAIFGCVLMISWSGAQANQLAAILDSPLFGEYQIPTYITGPFVALIVLFALLGGIKRISAISAKIVPSMFLLFLGSCTWILIANADKLGDVFTAIFVSAFSPYAMASGTLVGGIVSALRWGVFKGTQATEAGLGTQTIPHSMAETNDPKAQGVLAMVSTYTAGFVAFLSGCVVLVTDTWQDPTLPLGINMLAASFYMHFSYAGLAVIAICTLLFAYGTILGNSYNGSQCYKYLAKRTNLLPYYLVTAFVVFAGAIAGIKEVWTLIDVALAFLIVPHMTALIKHAYFQEKTVKPPQKSICIPE